MPRHSQGFHSLAHEFDELVQRLNESPNLKERTQSLRRMKILIDEIDGLIFSTLKRDKQDVTSSAFPDQPTGD